MSRKAKLSKRRLEVLASYGVFPKKDEQLPSPPKPQQPIFANKERSTNKQFEFDSLPDFSSLPKNSPIRIQRELEAQGIDTATSKLNAKTSRQEVLNNMALRTKQTGKRHKPLQKNNENHLVNNIHLDGLLSAYSAKEGTKDAPSIINESSAFYYNMADNFIEEQHHEKASCYDPRFIDLIEIQESGKMIWHGETCAICTMPPSTIGEVMLAQYGEADFICIDCGKMVEIKNPTMRGWIFAQVQNNKRHKATQIKKYHLPHAEDDEELD